jgi:hypothetical protein
MATFCERIFLTQKNSRYRRINGNLERLKGKKKFFWLISPSDIFKLVLENELTPPLEFCTDEDNSVIRSAMDASRNSKN